MSAATPQQPAPRNDDRLVYWVLGVIAVVLAVIGLIVYDSDRDDAEAQQKAEQLAQKFEQAGLRVPADLDIIVRSLGDDGGPVCESPDDALGRAILYDQLANGASHVGRRPVIVDPKVVVGELLIIETYCPERLEDYRDIIDDLKTDDTIKD